MFSKDKSIIENREFNEHYFVDCIDQEWVSNSFNSSLTDLILSRKNVTIEGSRNYLLIYYKKKRIQIDKLIKEYEFALDIFNVMIGGGSGEFV